MDFGLSDKKLFLIESRFISFENLNLEKYRFSHTRTPGGWRLVEEEPELERELCKSMLRYIRLRCRNLQPIPARQCMSLFLLGREAIGEGLD